MQRHIHKYLCCEESIVKIWMTDQPHCRRGSCIFKMQGSRFDIEKQ